MDKRELESSSHPPQNPKQTNKKKAQIKKATGKCSYFAHVPVERELLPKKIIFTGGVKTVETRNSEKEYHRVDHKQSHFEEPNTLTTVLSFVIISSHSPSVVLRMVTAPPAPMRQISSVVVSS